MEIHPPTRPVESVKDFLIHLSMITIGILIALGLEQAVEAWHQHALGVEARENIISEIRDNKKEIDDERVLIEQNREKLKHTLDTLHQFLAHKKLDHAEMSIQVNAASLNATSWTTAQATGTLGYMGYEAAKKFAPVYDTQGLLQRLQEEQFRVASNALAPIANMPGGPEKLSDDQLRAIERDVLACLSGVTMWGQIASQLSDQYGRALKGQ